MFFPQANPFPREDAPTGTRNAGPLDAVMQSGYTRQRQMSLSDLLMENRIIFIGSSPEYGQPAIDDLLANYTIQKLLWLATDKKTADIHLYINSPGGSISAGLAIYDAIQFIGCPVNTYCIGMAASMAAVLLAAGTKGKRYALPNSKMMLHQPRLYDSVFGQVSDMEIFADEMEKMKTRMNEILALHTGQTMETIEKQTQRDYYLTAHQAKEFGLIDEVLMKTPDVKK